MPGFKLFTLKSVHEKEEFKKILNKAFGFLIFPMWPMVLGFIYWNQSALREKLTSRHDITTGYLVDFSTTPKTHGGYIYYRFSVNGKSYKSNMFYDTMNDDIYASLLSEPLTVIYQIGDTSNNQILLLKRDYVRYKLPVPDVVARLND